MLLSRKALTALFTGANSISTKRQPVRSDPLLPGAEDPWGLDQLGAVSLEGEQHQQYVVSSSGFLPFLPFGNL